MGQLLECLAEEPEVEAIEGSQVDQFLAKGNLVKELKDVVRLVLEEGESEDAALTVNEESPKEEEVRIGVRYGHDAL